MQPLEAGEPTVIGPYRLLGRLGAGGMGRVYLGRSSGGRTVAVKVVHPHFALDEEFRERFRREVEAARRVGGAWTAPVLDADPEASVPWAATGYVAGPALSRAVGERGLLPALPEHSVRVLGAGLGESLAAVHGLGLVHRDVKPSNVLLSLDGPRLIDFGIARAVDGTASLTSTGVSIGSPGYMSPEQILGKGVTGAADVFSLGAVLAYAATGGAPFAGDSSAALLYKVVHEEPELALPDGDLHTLIAACLAKNPADRPTPQELAARLAPDGAAALAAPGWLPAPLVEQVSRSAVSLLDLEATGEAPSGPVPFTNASVAGGTDGGTGAPGPGPGAAGPTGGAASAGDVAAAEAGGTFGPPDPSYAGGLPASTPATGDHPRTEGAPAAAHGQHGVATQTGPGKLSVSVAAGSARDADGRGRKVSCTVALAVAGALAAVTLGSAFMFDLLPGGGGGGNENAGGAPSDGASAHPSDGPSDGGSSGGPDATTSPDEGGPGPIPKTYLGTWEGRATADALGRKLPAGTMKVVVKQGKKGEEIGTAAMTDELGASTCTDILELTSVSEKRLVAKAVPADKDDARCSSNTGTVTLTARGDGLTYALKDPKAGNPTARLAKPN
ncbi:Serine/threonine-protein kinase AfsK [Streptomyces sp. YIM 130001]|uniref:serine/threonine-protein kinase n=1 Tax=Streptomyces sp. YIM 130001 TaxID=2259644 RepID=UPI000E657EE3|nr:serine/threonine-protein kinase [Streptomyces sp. YIM 130001]RII22165.1 Serine/threonine-protein kinase AfsK [Streptomyces sp. YIM 130001]